MYNPAVVVGGGTMVGGAEPSGWSRYIAEPGQVSGVHQPESRMLSCRPTKGSSDQTLEPLQRRSRPSRRAHTTSKARGRTASSTLTLSLGTHTTP
jgi:hypothetical protein